MPTKDEIVAGLRDVDQRIERLTPRIVANLEQPMASGDWTVHDVLCHIATYVNAVPRFHGRVAAAAEGRTPSTQRSGDELDAYNEERIAGFKTQPIEDLLREIRAGLAADIENIPQLDDALLTRDMPNPRGEMSTGAATLLQMACGHQDAHLKDIEAALGT